MSESSSSPTRPCGHRTAGQPIGVLTLSTTFDKPPGHIRHAATLPFPVRYREVAGATPQRIVHDADTTLLEPFVSAARELERDGVAAITTSCGFLALFQHALAAAVGVPVLTSSVLLAPLMHRTLLPDQHVGILVAQARTFGVRHLDAAGAADVPVRIAGMDDQPEFTSAILDGEHDAVDVPALRDETLRVAASLVHDHPSVGAIILECTDLSPFASDIRAQTGRPVIDIVALAGMIHATGTTMSK